MTIFTRINRQTQCFVCFNSIETFFLQTICINLVTNTDTASFMTTDIDQDSPFFIDALKSVMKLSTAAKALGVAWP